MTLFYPLYLIWNDVMPEKHGWPQPPWPPWPPQDLSESIFAFTDGRTHPAGEAVKILWVRKVHQNDEVSQGLMGSSEHPMVGCEGTKFHMFSSSHDILELCGCRMLQLLGL